MELVVSSVSSKKEEKKECCRVCSFFFFFLHLNFIEMRKAHDRGRQSAFPVNSRPSHPYSFFFCESLLNRFLSKIYIFVYLCIRLSHPFIPHPLSLPLSLSFFSHGFDRPPNARVLRTDIRTIKKLLMVRIWSRWVAGVRRRNQPYRYFTPRSRRRRSRGIFLLTIVSERT